MAKPRMVEIAIRYCATCGEQLQRTRLYISHHDRYTGKPVHFATLICPNRNWRTLWSHDRKETYAYIIP